MPRVCPSCGRRFDTQVEHCPDDGSPTFLVRREEDLVGTTVDDRFTLKEILGIGGMGAVYRAHQHSMDRDVALKLMRPETAGDEQAVRRFFREARAASKLNNPHTITVFDFGQTRDGMLYIAMELLRGRSLAKTLRDLGAPMEPARAIRIADQVLDSLDEAHANGILHRDLKPDNVFLLDTRGGEDFVKVLDFGIAKMREPGGQSLTGTGMAFGTPTYMSPEQAQARELDARSDLYSVGVLLFEMLAGKPPFEAETPLAMALKKVQERAPTVYHVNPDVRIPESLERLLASLLDSNPDARPKSASECRALLAEAAKDQSAIPMPSVVVRSRTTEVVRALKEPEAARASTPEPTPYRVRPALGRPAPRRRLPAWVMVLAAATGVTLALAGWMVMTAGPDTAPRLIEPQPVSSSAEAPGRDAFMDMGTTLRATAEAPDPGPASRDERPPPPAVATPQAPPVVERKTDDVRQPGRPNPAWLTPRVRPGKRVDTGVDRLLKSGRVRPAEDTIRLKGTR